MSVGAVLLLAFLALVVAASVWVSRRAWRAHYLNRRQQWIVIGFAWLLPIIGPALAYSVLGEHGIRKRGARVTLLEVAFLSLVLSQGDVGGLKSDPRDEGPW
jgi:hypothetical protein